MGGLDRMIQTQDQTGVATGDPEADALLRRDGNALLIGVLLDQQMRAEIAFAGPHKLQERLGHLDYEPTCCYEGGEAGETLPGEPAVHRFPASSQADYGALYDYRSGSGDLAHCFGKPKRCSHHSD